MEKLDVKSGPLINHYQEDYKKIQFEFFQFMNGQIQMIVSYKKKKVVVNFTDMQDFTKRAVGNGLPSQYINLVSRIFNGI